MIPDLSAFLILLGLVPGWVFWTLRAKYVPKGTRSGLAEALELVAVGLATTGLALVGLVFAARLRIPLLVDVPQLAAEGGGKYFPTHLEESAATIFIVLAVACALSWGLCRWRWHGSPQHDANASVWWHALRQRPDQTSPYVGVCLQDGTLVEGLLAWFTPESEASKRDIALDRPIRVTPQGGRCQKSTVDRVVIPDSTIRWITVVHVPNP